MIKVAVIILNWNRADYTLACASSVLDAFDNMGADYVSGRIVIVDNASEKTDSDALITGVNELSSRSPAPEIEFNAANLGYAQGMNAGIQRVRDWEPDYIWLLNNDTLADSKALQALLEFAAQFPEGVVLGSTIVDPASKTVTTAGGYKYCDWLGWNRPVLAGYPLHETAGIKRCPTLDYVDGAALWLNGNFLRRIGGIPEHHFLYFEELALTKLLANDESVAWCRDSVVFHHKAGSSPTKELQSRSAYYAAYAAYSYTWRENPVCLPTVILSRILGVGLVSVFRSNSKLFVAVVSALSDFIQRKPANYHVR